MASLRLIYLTLMAAALLLCPGCGCMSGAGSESQSASRSPSTPSYNPPTGLSYAPSVKTGYDGVTIAALVPTVTGTVTNFSISPPLPSGLTLNSTTGLISGTPVGVAASTVYMVTASNADGNATATVTIVIGPNFTVTSTGNGGDGNPGDSSCNNGSGQCTLRAAVEEANAGTLPVKINLPDGTYSLAGQEIPVTSSVNLNGTSQAGTILDAGGLSRIFNSTSLDLSVTKLTIQNGSGGSTGTSQGGGIKHARAGSSLTLDQVTMSGNQTDADSYGGGAIYYGSGSKLTISNSIFNGNSQTQGNGSTLGGGAIFINSLGTVTISASQFTGNSATASGGAIYDKSAGMVISDSTFDTNSSNDIFGGGGAIYSDSPKLKRNLFKGNNANGNGGGLFLSQSQFGSIENCTFYSNSASAVGGIGGKGGALYVQWAIIDGSLFSNNTLVANTASISAGGYYCSNCLTADRFLNNIFSANTNGNCAFQLGGANSQGSNIDSANTCGFAGTGDLINTDPLVVAGAPASNGGPTLSIALQAGSPARDAGASAGCPATDQRGVDRPNNGQCDIGAYEY